MKRIYHQLPSPFSHIMVGACSGSGGERGRERRKKEEEEREEEAGVPLSPSRAH